MMNGGKTVRKIRRIWRFACRIPLDLVVEKEELFCLSMYSVLCTYPSNYHQLIRHQIIIHDHDHLDLLLPLHTSPFLPPTNHTHFIRRTVLATNTNNDGTPFHIRILLRVELELLAPFL